MNKIQWHSYEFFSYKKNNWKSELYTLRGGSHKFLCCAWLTLAITPLLLLFIENVSVKNRNAIFRSSSTHEIFTFIISFCLIYFSSVFLFCSFVFNCFFKNLLFLLFLHLIIQFVICSFNLSLFHSSSLLPINSSFLFSFIYFQFHFSTC